MLDEVEAALIGADVGLSTTVKIIESLEKNVSTNKYLNLSQLNDLIKNEITQTEKILISSLFRCNNVHGINI